MDKVPPPQDLWGIPRSLKTLPELVRWVCNHWYLTKEQDHAVSK